LTLTDKGFVKLLNINLHILKNSLNCNKGQKTAVSLKVETQGHRSAVDCLCRRISTALVNGYLRMTGSKPLPSK